MGEWVKWIPGLEAPQCTVNVRFRDGIEMPAIGSHLRWSHNGGNADIIAYRVIESEQQAQITRIEPHADASLWNLACDQQAHAMSHPGTQKQERQHISDAAWEAHGKYIGTTREYCERLHATDGVVLLTVAEHDELTKEAELSEVRLQAMNAQTEAVIRAMAKQQELAAERDNLRAELAARTQAWEGEEWKLRGDASAKTRDHPNLQIDPEVRAKLTAEELETIYRRFDEFERLLKGREDDENPQTVAAGGMVATASEGAHIRSQALVRAMGQSLSAATADPRLGIPRPEGVDDFIGTMIWHSHNADGSPRTEHCCGCWTVQNLPSGLCAICNECGERQEIVIGKGMDNGSHALSLKLELERLRKGREDERNSGTSRGVDRVLGVDCANLLSCCTDTLNPRLGIPQPDGEPVEPMSARKAYRWGMM